MDKKIFVVGAPRSGTSYLARALSLADHLAFFEESAAFHPYANRRWPMYYRHALKMERTFKYNATEDIVYSFTDFIRRKDRLGDLVHRMLLHTKLGPYDLSPSDMLTSVQNCKLSDYDYELKNQLLHKYRRIGSENGLEKQLQELFSDYVSLQGKNHLLEKTPNHIAYVPVIRSVFPDAKIVVMKRNKRDTVSSFVKNFDARTSLRNKFLSDRMLLIKQSQTCVYFEKIELWLERQPWCRTVNYKQMVETPLETVTGVLEWLDLRLDIDSYGSLFHPHEATSTWDSLDSKQKSVVERLLKND